MDKRFSLSEVLLRMIDEKMGKVKHKVIIASAKGGVGKSFIASTISLALADLGYRTGLLDVDVHASSIPMMLGVGKVDVYIVNEAIEPATGPLGLKFISLSLMMDSLETPLAWRGLLKTKAVLELLAKTDWGEIDFLIIDTPAGVGDEVLTVIQSVKNIDGFVLVTAPGYVTEIVVSRSMNFFVKVGLKPLGLIENFSFFKCPDSGKNYKVFGESNLAKIAEKFNVKLFVKLPIDPEVQASIESGKPYYLTHSNSELSMKIKDFVNQLVAQVAGANSNY